MRSCGTDIIKVSRIKSSIDEIGENFLKRVFTDGEIEYCESKKVTKYQSYAVRFAAKEAVYKALSYSDYKDVSWKDIEVCIKDNGRPYIILHGLLKVFTEKENIKNIDVSLSHDDDYAIAMVITE